MTSTAVPMRRRRAAAARTWVFMPAAFLVAGCTKTDLYLGNNQMTWLWGVAPFGLFLLAGWLWVQAARGSALRNWRLQEDPIDPGAGSAIGWLIGIGLALLIAFALLNAFGEFATRQKMINIALWLTASAFGALLGIAIGLRLADRSYVGRYGDPK